MRVLVATLPLWGHIQPLLPLATALQRRGHELVWASGPDACPRIERLGITTAPAGLTEADFTAARAEGQRRTAHLPPDERPNWLGPWLFGAARAGPMLRDLTPDRRGLAAGPGRARPSGVRLRDRGERGRHHPCHPRVRRGATEAARHPDGRRRRRIVARGGADAQTVRRQLRPPLPRPLPAQPCRHAARPHPRPAADPPGVAVAVDPDPAAGRPASPGRPTSGLRDLRDGVQRGPVARHGGGRDLEPARLRGGDRRSQQRPGDVGRPADDTCTSRSSCPRTTCCRTARPWSPTADREPSWPVWPGDCHSCSCLKGPISSSTRTPARAPGVAIVLRPPEQEPRRVREALAAVLEDRSLRDRAGALAAEIAEMPSADEVVDRLEGL